MQSFFDWFIGEAGAGWIIGLLGIAGALYAWLKRERPPKLVIQEVKKLKILDIHPSQYEKLEVFYSISETDRRTIQKLEQREFAIYNNGTRDILTPLSVTLLLSDETIENDHSLQQWVFDDPECSAKAILDDQNGKVTGICFEIPYMNSYPIHKHYLKAYLISNQENKYELSQRVGKGWSAYFVPLDEFLKLQKRINLMIALVILVTLVTMLWMFLVSDLMRPYFSPTTQNIERFLQLYRDYFYGIQTTGFSARFTGLSSLYGGIQLLILFSISVIVAVMSSFERQKVIATMVLTKYLGVQPPTKFIKPSSSSDSSSRFWRLVEKLGR